MNPTVLEFVKIGKSFFNTAVLKDITFSIRGGSVLGLVGENGAGKSTLMNIMSGIFSPDKGTMNLDGERFEPDGPGKAAEAGIALVHQELNLFTNLSVAENLFLSDFPRIGPSWLNLIDRRKLNQRAYDLLKRVRLEVDPSAVVEELSPGQRQLLEIAVALKGLPRIVAFDEPTTSLTRPEVDHLFRIIGELKQKEIGTVYISHNLGEVMRVCDEIVVLRDGEIKGRGSREDFSIPRIIELMVGRKLKTMFPERKSNRRNAPALEVRNLSQPGVAENISFVLQQGEILGIAGLMGSGRSELVRMIFGLDPCSRGKVLIRGKTVQSPSPGRSVKRGLAYLTEDRTKDGLLQSAGIEENLSLVGLKQFSGFPFGTIRGKKLRARIKEMAGKLNIRARSLQHQTVRTLSGGNQQKTVLGKWLLANSNILLLDEPTRGVDIGARFEIYKQIISLVDQGASVLLISSEMEELMGLSDRILVMSQGRIQGPVNRDEFDQNALLRTALGKDRLN
jgi:ribose transport system ATP-binding protein